MSRSIHTNRSRRQFGKLGLFIDWNEIHRKQDLKSSALRDREIDMVPNDAVSADLLLIDVADRSPYLFFPASIEDMRAVLRALPVGSLDGVAAVRLEAGTRYINAGAKWHAVIDPFLGRKSVQIFSTVYLPMIFGTYSFRSQTVRLFGYAKSPRTALSQYEQAALELHSLATLVHEVAHHFDRLRRMGGGRPWSAMGSKAEEFADERMRVWTMEIILPYLRRKHGAATLAKIPNRVRRSLCL